MNCAIFIDPGVAGKGCACAAFVGTRLAEVWFERVPTFKPGDVPAEAPHVARWERAGGISLVVVERPALQGERTRRANPEHLMALAWEGALLAGAFAGRDGAPIVALTPAEWKGSEPKPVQHARMWRVLDAAERKLLGGETTHAAILRARERGALNRWGRPGVSYYPRAFETHNILDAVAMGCTYFSRIERTG